MHNFRTIRCSTCGSVIFNLPEKMAKKLRKKEYKCEDCTYNTMN